MRARFKLTLMVSFPVQGKTLGEAVAAAGEIDVNSLVKFKPGAEYEDGKIEATGVETGDWVDHD